MDKNIDLIRLIRGRRSIRKYKKKEIPDEIILKILEAGQWAPSASNNQPWRFIIIRDATLRKEIGNLCSILGVVNSFVEKAPLIIVIFSEYSHRWVEVDCSMCAQNMMLEAHSLGIGSCFIGAFDRKGIKNLLSLPEKSKIIGLITFGYSDKEEKSPGRYDLEKLVFYEKFSKRKINISLFKKIMFFFAGKILREN
jgi:nitroreductase